MDGKDKGEIVYSQDKIEVRFRTKVYQSAHDFQSPPSHVPESAS
jgi:hypothetical protein